MGQARRQTKQTDYQLIFCAHNGPGPYQCVVCGEDVQPPWRSKGRSRESLHVHHKDRNHDNNDPTNLVPAHAGCHARLHKQEQKLKPRHVTALRIGVRGWWSTKTKEERRTFMQRCIDGSLETRRQMTPEQRRASYGHRRGSTLSESARNEKSETMKHLWTDPDYRQRNLAARLTPS